MSKYTTEVRFICEHYAGLEDSEGYNSVDEIIGNSREKVFDFNYPIFDENYRSALECKILKHFYLREICAETVGVWKLFLNRKMNEIMPYYNQLYESALLEFDPFKDVDVTTTRDIGKEGEENSNGNTTKTGNDKLAKTGADVTNVDGTVTADRDGTDKVKQLGSETDGTNRWVYFSDTPQGGIEGMELDDNTYLTTATHETNTDTVSFNGREADTVYDSTTTTTYDTSTTQNYGSNATTTYNTAGTNVVNGTFSNTEDYLEKVVGKRNGMSYSEMLELYRKTFLNIDMLIINDLEDCFFTLW